MCKGGFPLNTQWDSEPRCPMAHKRLHRSCEIRLNVEEIRLICGEKDRIQFRCWRDFGGDRASLLPVLLGGEGNETGYEGLELVAERD